jgi:hypothetical protein
MMPHEFLVSAFGEASPFFRISKISALLTSSGRTDIFAKDGQIIQ